MCYLLALLHKTISEELNEYVYLLGDIRNPIFLSLIITAILTAIIYLAIQKAVFPYIRKTDEEKVQLQMQNARLLAVFAEHDPKLLQKLKEEVLEISQNELNEYSRAQQKIVEEERKRISRELHDDIGQQMVLLKLTLQKDFCELTHTENPEVFTRNAILIDNISKDLKDISFRLFPYSLEETGLYSSLTKLMEAIQQKSGIRGQLDFISTSGRLGYDLEIAIYRIVQEAISNIVKYSGAKEYNVQLIKRNDALRLIISDEGKGFDPEESVKGMGIRNMKQRAGIYRGVLKINSSKEEGTKIVVDFPMENKRNGKH
ncbi:MAG: sensor histidine kinase [Bacillota bacterium]